MRKQHRRNVAVLSIDIGNYAIPCGRSISEATFAVITPPLMLGRL